VAFVNQRGVWIKHYGDLVSTRAKPADLEELPPSPRQVRRDAMILAAIETEALDAYDLAEKVHAARRYLLTCLTRLHDSTPKRVFIRKWHTRSGAMTPTPMWQAGDDPDAPRPRARTTKEQNRISHARRLARRAAEAAQ
jgi:hypothetical protein